VRFELGAAVGSEVAEERREWRRRAVRAEGRLPTARSREPLDVMEAGFAKVEHGGEVASTKHRRGRRGQYQCAVSAGNVQLAGCPGHGPGLSKPSISLPFT